MSRVIALTVLLLALLPRESFAVPMITFLGGPTDFRIDQVTEVNIGGTNYTATFTHGQTFTSVYPSGPTFTTQVDVDAAILALRTTINGFAIDSSTGTASTHVYIVPSGTGLGLGGVDAAADFVANVTPMTYAPLFPHMNDNVDEVVPLGQNFAWVSFTPESACDILTTTDFESPMGKNKKVGSALPIKLQFFFEDTEITSQAQLDQVLTDNGCNASCPEIVIIDVTDEANELAIELPDDLGNVGQGGDLGTCFRFSGGRWVYNLKLDAGVFDAGRTYQVDVRIDDSLLGPANASFQTK